MLAKGSLKASGTSSTWLSSPALEKDLALLELRGTLA